ncbi:MAG TPA: ankyrin repeat domain-containing protein [Vicinamibacterales bacterium]
MVKRIVGAALVALMVSADGGLMRAAGASTALIDAVRKKDVAAVRMLLKQPGAANVATADGATPLHWATDLDDLAVAQLLVRAGADVKAKNRYGVTPMYSAAVNGNAAMIELLLKAGADPNVALPEGETPLMTASKTGKVDAMRVLLAHGANVNAKETWKQQTALMWAAHEGNADAVKLLLESGANVSDRSMFGWTALLFAARQGEIGAIQALLAGGAKIDETLPDGTSALVTAVQGLNYEAAYVLLQNGIDPNASAQGWTALHQIAWSRRPQRGQNNPGQKPQGNLSSLDLAKKLVEFGADINARQTREPNSDMEGRNSLNRYGATPFFLAAKSVDVPLMQTLLEIGADPFIGNVDGDSPLMVAAGVGVYSQGESPGQPEESADAVKLLLDLGAPVNEMDRNRETAMHGPAWRGSNEAVMHLVNAGERLDVRNNRGWLPLTIADGVYYNARVMMNKHTAKLLRELMVARGLDASDTGTNLGGAIRSEIEDENEIDVQNPSEVQQRLIEQQKKRQEALKGLQK